MPLRSLLRPIRGKAGEDEQFSPLINRLRSQKTLNPGRGSLAGPALPFKGSVTWEMDAKRWHVLPFSLSRQVSDGTPVSQINTQVANTERKRERSAEKQRTPSSLPAPPQDAPQATATNERLMTRSYHLSGLTSARLLPSPLPVPSRPRLHPSFCPSPPFISHCIHLLNSGFYSPIFIPASLLRIRSFIPVFKEFHLCDATFPSDPDFIFLIASYSFSFLLYLPLPPFPPPIHRKQKTSKRRVIEARPDT